MIRENGGSIHINHYEDVDWVENQTHLVVTLSFKIWTETSIRNGCRGEYNEFIPLPENVTSIRWAGYDISVDGNGTVESQGDEFTDGSELIIKDEKSLHIVLGTKESNRMIGEPVIIKG